MHQAFSTAIGIAGITFHACAYSDSAVSDEAKALSIQRAAIVKRFDVSMALFAPKSEAISRLNELALEYAEQQGLVLHPVVLANSENFVRALPDGISMPEFSVEPDGCISLDWMKSRTRVFCLSIGFSNRLAFAWLNGTDTGRAVHGFDGEKVPDTVIALIKLIS